MTDDQKEPDSVSSEVSITWIQQLPLKIMTDCTAKVSLPIRPPTIHKDDPRSTLEESQQSIYDEVVEHFSRTDYSIPHIEEGELMDQEKFWLSRECILR